MKAIVALLCTLAAGLIASTAFAQAYPAKPVRIVVPIAGGGPTDVIARDIAQKLTVAWKQQVIVDNRPGAGGIIGAEIVAKAPADGYTILMNNAAFAITPSLYRKAPFDAVKDFAPVSQLTSALVVLVANPQFKSLKELLARAKAAPGTLNFATPGIGTSNHLLTERIKLAARVNLVHVPYKGDAQSIPALLGGEVQMAILPYLGVAPHIKSGKVNLLAVISGKRAPILPEVPTLAEAGVPGIEYTGWLGFFAPVRTPRPIVNQVSAEAARVLQLPEIRERLSAGGFDPVGSTPEEFSARFNSDVTEFARVIREANIPLAD